MGASDGTAEVETEATEPVEDLRSPLNDIESRLLLRGKILPDVPPDTWRGTRDVEIVEGDALTEVFLTPALLLTV